MSSVTTTASAAPTGNRPSGLQRFSFFGVNPGVLIGFLVLLVGLFLTTPTFRKIATMQNLAQQVSLNAIIAVGMTFVIITAGIDLSVGSIQGLVGVVTAMTLLSPAIVGRFGAGAIGFALVAGLAVGSLVGFLNGLVISRLKMQPFIVTLATMWAVRGLAEVLTDGSPIGMQSDDAPMAAMRNDILQNKFTVLGMGYVGPSAYGIPVAAVIAVVVIIAAHLLLSRTIFGRHVYALGGNTEAARLSGVNVDRVKLLVYTLSGLLSGVAAILLTSKLVSGQPTAGQSYELYAIAAVVVGGTSLFGGSGSVIGSVIGALIIGVINMGLDLHGISAFYQQIVTGAIILIAVLLDNILRRRAG
jgi:ribose transport system permease protein